MYYGGGGDLYVGVCMCIRTGMFACACVYRRDISTVMRRASKKTEINKKRL